MARKKQAASAAPAGYRVLNARAPIWQPQPGDVLQGIIMQARSLDAKQAGRKDAKKGEKVRILSIADADGVLCDVWESHALSALMDTAKPGDSVYLRFNELVKRGRRRYKDFTVALKSAKGSK